MGRAMEQQLRTQLGHQRKPALGFMGGLQRARPFQATQPMLLGRMGAGHMGQSSHALPSQALTTSTAATGAMPAMPNPMPTMPNPAQMAQLLAMQQAQAMAQPNPLLNPQVQHAHLQALSQNAGLGVPAVSAPASATPLPAPALIPAPAPVVQSAPPVIPEHAGVDQLIDDMIDGVGDEELAL